jgi:copper chaperone CopZ
MAGQKNTIKLAVHGMTCGSCRAHVTKALSEVQGVESVDVDLAQGEATVMGGEAAVDTTQLIQAVQQAGYHAAVMSGQS